MRGNFSSYTFIPLFLEPWSESSCERLRSTVSPDAETSVRCVRPPVHGLAFVSASGQVSSVLDEWWRANIAPDSLPVLLMLHEPELQAWVGGLDAAFVIGVADDTELGLYAGCDNVIGWVGRDPTAITEHAMRSYGGDACFRLDAITPLLDGPEPDPRAEIPVIGSQVSDPEEPAAKTPYTPRLRPDLYPGAQPPSGPVAPPPSPSSSERLTDPFQALMSARPVMSPAGRGPEGPSGDRGVEIPGRPPQPQPVWHPGAGSAPAARRRPVREKQRKRARISLRAILGKAAGGLHGGGRHSAIPEELTRLALAHREGKIVGVISRAGGVGKTAVAAAVGIVYGEAVQESGWCAAVVDQNIGNPDQWGRMDVGPQVRTVSQIMADVEAGREWTIPGWNRTAALAVYPESRSAADAYAPAQIERLAGQLRQLHAVSVIDLPNRMPAFTSGEAALCAGWVAVADLIAIPTTDDPTRLMGVMELLDAPLIRGDARTGYRSVPVVVAYVRSPLRAIRESSEVKEILNQIRERAVEVVEIPKNERATLAIVRGRPITEIDSALRAAYTELAMAIARTLAEE